MKTVAITGGTGFIGHHVLPLLLARGCRIRALARPGSAHVLPTGVEAVAGDVTDPNSVASLISGCDTVLHLAGQAHTDLRTPEDRRRAIDVNVGGARNVLSVSRTSGVRRVVIASSAHVYAGQCGRGVREDAPSAAENLYAQTKIDVEKLAAEFAQRGLDVVIGRPCLTYGPNARFNLFKLMQAINRGRYFHVGHLSVERSFCSAYSAAAAFVFLAEKGKSGETYNIADQQPSLLEDFTNDLADLMRRPRPRRIPRSLLWTAAAGFSLLSITGIAGPINLASLRKLTQDFSISVDKLANAGFVWPDRGDRARTDMVDTFLAGAQ
jgi:nucleoside-diphosphate-sugar epimerase